ncbi:MAG: AraC family transcriptional regulator [Eubacteriales bacterium]|nr:AraC family transcriptional regulator [Eubacteriales bacterium]
MENKKTSQQNYRTLTTYDMDSFPMSLRLENLNHCPGQGTTLHWHDEVEFIIALKGTVTCHVDGDEIFIKTGEGLFINARQPHISCAGDDKENLTQLVEILPSCLESLPFIREKYIDKIIENAALPWLLLKPEVLWQKEILLNLKNIPAWYGSPAAPLRIMSAFAEMWALLYENTGRYDWKAEETQERVIMRDMIGLIQHNYKEKLTLKDIADAGGVSISKCCSLFSSSYQTTTINYLLEYRLSESALLLRNTKDTVTDIALSCGFADSNYFTRRFRMWSGLTPTEYRREGAEPIRLHG